MLQNLIKSKTRIRLLIKFFVNIANRGYLNGLASEFDESTNSVRTELNNLTKAGYLSRVNENNKIIYKANVKHPLFPIINKLVLSHLGIEKIIENVVSSIGDVKKIYLLNDYAQGIDSGNIEVLIVGSNLNTKYLDNLKLKVEKEIDRSVNFFISSNLKYSKGLLIFEV